MPTVVGIRFKKAAKIYYFDPVDSGVEKGDFDFPVSYKIASYKIQIIGGGDAKPATSVKGEAFPADIIAQIKKARRGTKVYIEEITAVGPVGEVQVSNKDMIFTIQ